MKFAEYTFVFDIDGTICPVKQSGESYEELVPFSEMVEKLNYYHENGARIILCTSRNMRTYGGNIGLINKHTAAVLLKWLDKWAIPYDEIIYGKPWAGKKGFYVDDRTLRPDEFLHCTIDEMDKICTKSRCKPENRGTGES